jgi:hypothetical protein
MRYNREIKGFLNFRHISDIFDKLPIVLVPVVFEENKYEKLVLREDLLGKFAGIG